MLTKHTEIEIPADNPFANDQLERKKIAENLTLLVQSTNQPFVISIEAPWGWGKTTFINMWKTHLESLGHTCLYFNAWENDFVDDPLIALIGEISKALEDKKAKGTAEKQLKRLQTIGGKIVRRALPLTIQIATHGLLSQDSVKDVSSVLLDSSDEIASLASELAEEKIKQYENDKNGIEEFKKELAKFAKSISESKEKRSPLVFFIDELDRCRPDFSITLLERIKHIFNVHGIVFILGMDRSQIEQSVRSLYGQEMKEDGYLRRFIDFRFRLPEPPTKSFCNFLFNQFHMQEALQNRRKYSEEKDILLHVFIKVAESFKFSLRVIEQCFTEINVILRTTAIDTELFPHVLSFLVALKASKPELYEELRNDLSVEQILSLIEDIKQEIDMQDHKCRWTLALIEAELLHKNFDEAERNIIENLILKVDDEKNSKEEQKFSQQVSAFTKEFELGQRYSQSIRFISSRLDAIEELKA